MFQDNQFEKMMDRLQQLIVERASLAGDDSVSVTTQLVLGSPQLFATSIHQADTEESFVWSSEERQEYRAK